MKQKSRGYQALKAKTTIGEVLTTAMSFEKAAYEFYESLEARVSDRLRHLVQELITEEKSHYALFEKLAERPDVQVHIREKINLPKNADNFSSYTYMPKLGEAPLDDKTIVQYALGREQAAMEQYSALADETPAGPIQDLFRFLANEELEHKQELEKRYADLLIP